MTRILKAKEIADKMKEEIRKDISILKESNISPKIGIVRIGKNPDDIYYENSVIRNAEKLGIESFVLELEQEISTDDLVYELVKLNMRQDITGILLLRPLPKHIVYSRVRDSISENKDIDCMHPLNLSKIFEGDFRGFMPCTASSALEILKAHDIELEGKDIVIINRSLVVGKPLAMMLLNENATVSICHSKTKNLKEYTKKADIVITALGQPKIFTKEYFSEESILIDVGVGVDENGRLSGDIDFESVEGHVKAVTPVPGGVGSLTTTILLSHIVKAAFLNENNV